MKRKTKDLIIYYFSHRTGTTQWVDPRMAQVKKATVDDCDEDGTLSVFLGNLIFFFFFFLGGGFIMFLRVPLFFQ